MAQETRTAKRESNNMIDGMVCKPLSAYGLQAWIVDITPEIAAEMLKCNTHNRLPRKTTILHYARQMIADDWMMTAEAIHVTNDGLLLNGQHRLLAIIKANTTVPILVIWGLSREAQDLLDHGDKRRISDTLTMNEFATDAKTTAAAIGHIRRMAIQGRVERGNWKLTDAEAKRFMRSDADGLYASMVYARDVARETKYPRSLACALHYMLACIDRTDANQFFGHFATGDLLVTGDPVRTLREWTIRHPPGGRNERPKDTHFCRVTLKAWNAYRRNKSLKSMSISATEIYPDWLKTAPKGFELPLAVKELAGESVS